MRYATLLFFGRLGGSILFDKWSRHLTFEADEELTADK